jgi:hypothetical protein
MPMSMRAARAFPFAFMIAIVSAGTYADAAPSAAAGKTESEAEVAALVKGDILIEERNNADGVLGLSCRLLVKGDKTAVFSKLADPGFFMAVYPNMKEAKIVRSYPGGADVQYLIDAVIRKYRYVLARLTNARDFEITWTRVSGDLAYVRGKWSIDPLPVDGRLLVRYENYVDPEAGAAAGFYLSLVRFQTPKDLNRLRNLLEGGKAR